MKVSSDESRKAVIYCGQFLFLFFLSRFMICRKSRTHRNVVRDGNCNYKYFNELPGPGDSEGQENTQNYNCSNKRYIKH